MSGLAHSGEYEAEGKAAELAQARSLGGAGSSGKLAAGGKTRRKVPALVDGWRNLEQLRLQLGVLEDAIERRDFQAAQASAETVRTVEAGLAGTVERAERERADAAALALLVRSAEALRPQVAKALAKAPAPIRGLGVELGDGERDARREASWKAGLGSAQPREAQQARAGHEALEAALDNRIGLQVRAEKNLTAAAYLHHNMGEVRGALGDFFVAHLRSTGNARLAFEPSPGAFAHQLLSELKVEDASACVSTLRAWLSSAQLLEVVDRNRAILEEAEVPSEDYARGPKGPAAWTPAVGAAIGAELLRSAMQALPRLAQRWLEHAERAAALGQPIAPSLRSLAPTTPLERSVARALLGASGAPTVREVAATPEQVIKRGASHEAVAEPLQRLEALAGQIATDLAVIRQLDAHSRGRLDYSKQVTGKSLKDRYSDALVGLAELRGQLAGSGTTETARVRAVQTTLEDLRTETDLVKKIALVGQTFALFDEMTEDPWAIVGALVEKGEEGVARPGREPHVVDESDAFSTAGRLGSMEQARRTAARLKGELATLHSKWLKLQRRLAPLQGQAGSAAKAEIELEMQALRTDLNKLGNDAEVKLFLARAQVTAKNATHRAIFAQMAVMIGASVLSGGLGAVAEGAALQAGAGAMTAMAAGTAVEATSFSLLSSRLNGTSLSDELSGNLLGNFATFGAMRGTSALMSRTRLGGLLAAGEAKGMTLLAARAQALGAHTIVTAGVTYAQAQLEMLAKHGRTLTPDEQVQLGIQGMAMILGGGLVHHGMSGTMDGLRANGARMAYERENALELRRHIKQVAAQPDVAKRAGMHDQLRAKLEAELAHWQAQQGESEHGAAAGPRSATDGKAEQMTKVTQQHLDKLEEHAVRQLPTKQVSPEELFQLHHGLRNSEGAHLAKPTYDTKTREMSLVSDYRDAKVRYHTTLKPPITDLANQSQTNCLVGTKTFESLEAAQDVLRKIGAGDFHALSRQLGVAVPRDFSTRDGLEFGVGRLPNGEYVVVKGELGAVDWSALPGLRAEAHNHSSTKGNDLDPDAHGEARIEISEILKPSDTPLVARELILPSAPDLQFTAQQKLAAHRVITPFIVDGSTIRKPSKAHPGAVRLELVIHDSVDTGLRSRQGESLFRAEVSGTFAGNHVFRIEVYATLSDGIFLSRPDHLLEP